MNFLEYAAWKSGERQQKNRLELTLVMSSGFFQFRILPNILQQGILLLLQLSLLSAWFHGRIADVDQSFHFRISMEGFCNKTSFQEEHRNLNQSINWPQLCLKNQKSTNQSKDLIVEIYLRYAAQNSVKFPAPSSQSTRMHSVFVSDRPSSPAAEKFGMTSIVDELLGLLIAEWQPCYFKSLYIRFAERPVATNGRSTEPEECNLNFLPKHCGQQRQHGQKEKKKTREDLYCKILLGVQQSQREGETVLPNQSISHGQQKLTAFDPHRAFRGWRRGCFGFSVFHIFFLLAWTRSSQ